MSDIILVTGATGYIGGRLVPRLLEAGYSVRCMVRDAQRLQGYGWVSDVEVLEGDALDPSSMNPIFRGVTTAYYFIHGLQGGKNSVERDLLAARNFVSAAETAGLQRIIYLGELIDPDSCLFPYLQSRYETGRIFQQGGIPITEFRAGIVVGAGSVLFEMIRYLTERQLILLCPRWFFSLAQPISIRDILDYLVQSLNTPESVGKVIDIGGASQITYADMLQGYAEERGLKRFLVPTPIYAPKLSAYWVHMVTPIHWRVVLPLIQGLHSDILVHDNQAKVLFPTIQPLEYGTAVREALGNLSNEIVETSWDNALVISQGDIKPVKLTSSEGMLIEQRTQKVDLPAKDVFSSYAGLGGERGWLYLEWSWRIRGWMDKLIGGVGLRRGRRHPDEIRVGEALDFWRVEAITPDRMIRLRAEMKVPGSAWLEFQSIPQAEGGTFLIQTAYFAPRGISGFLYWYVLYPIHSFIFSGMIRQIAERAYQLNETHGKNKSSSGIHRG